MHSQTAPNNTSPPLPAIHVSPPIAIPSAANAIPNLSAIHVSAVPNLSAIVTRKLPAIDTPPAIATKNLAAKAGPRVRNSDRGYISAGGGLGPGFGPNRPSSLRAGPASPPPPIPGNQKTPAAEHAMSCRSTTSSTTPGDDTLGGVPVGGGPPVPRAYAPVSYGSNTVCGRYPHPARYPYPATPYWCTSTAGRATQRSSARRGNIELHLPHAASPLRQGQSDDGPSSKSLRSGWSEGVCVAEPVEFRSCPYAAPAHHLRFGFLRLGGRN